MRLGAGPKRITFPHLRIAVRGWEKGLLQNDAIPRIRTRCL
jgi:hypothetical protein